MIIAGKDLLIEFRTKQMLNMMVLFALLIILAFKFSFGTIKIDVALVAPTVLWITFAFAGMFGLSNSFGKEKDKESLSALLLCPAERAAIYVGKFISNLIILFIIEIASIVFFVIFFSYDLSGSVSLFAAGWVVSL